MKVQNLIIYESPILFDILNEIKGRIKLQFEINKIKTRLLKINNLEINLILSESPIDNLDNQILISIFQ